MTSKNTPITEKIYPWLVWLLAASFFYYKYLIQVSPGVISSQLMGAYSLSGAGLGNLAACFFYGYLLMQIPVGIILDRWSPRKVTSIAIFICALGVFLFSNTYSLLSAELSRFLIGLAAAFAAVSCFKLASIWFPPKRFAFIVGLSMTAAMLGAVGGEGPLSLLVNQFGWRHAFELISIAGIFLACAMYLIVRDKKSPSIINHQEIASIGLSTRLKIILKNKQTWLLSFYSGLAFAPVSVFGGLWGVSFLQKTYHYENYQAANLISLIFIGFAIGCPLAGWFSDYIGKRKSIMYAGTLLAFISILLIIYMQMTSILLASLLLLFGFGASCFFLCFSMIKELYPIAFTATVLGFMNTFDSICEALTEPFIGKLLDLSWSGIYENGVRAFSVMDYHLSLLTLPLYLFIALILLFFINETGENHVK